MRIGDKAHDGFHSYVAAICTQCNRLTWEKISTSSRRTFACKCFDEIKVKGDE